ncbi:hypothetical protein EUX98_g2296 [Antrodiella citrinella]|uniref:Uncharacterized protein n=1 Tax=Antrodiella citrinella TaxID=2447956 RepID=A0A4S4N2A0_9APHY|nr:hypothetical protein EUX98_g2296 [Antrodiella citrinella]
MPSEFKGKRKATDDEISYSGKHQKMDEEPEVKSLVAPEPSAPQVLEVMPEPTPMVVDPSSSALSPALPSLTPLPTDDAPSFTVLQDTGPSGAADLQADESVASADTKEEQVDQLMEDEDIEEYTEIKTPGVIQLEVEAQDEALKIALVPDLDSAPLVSSGFHISSSPEPPNLDIAPGPPSSHVTVTPPPDDHNLSIPFSLPQPSHSTSVIEQMLSQHFEQTVSPHLQAPSLPLLEHLIDADPLHPSNSSNLQRQDSSPQPPKAGPSKLPLFLPSDDDGSGSDDVILLATPRKTKARAPPSPGLMNDDFFILDASLLAGPELPSHALRTTRQSPVAVEGGSGARPKQRRVGGAAHRRQGHGTHRFAYVEIPSRPNWVEKIKAREEKRAGKQKAKTTAKVRARSESVVPATPEPGELQLGGGGDEAAGVLAPDLTDMHLPELPGGEVPTFLTDGLQVQQAAISRKLHEWLAPQVQDNIRGLGSRRTLTKMSVKRNSRLLEKIPAVTRAMREDPNATILSKARKPRDPFLPWKTSSRRRGPKFCSDFPTKEVSVLISQGYVCKGLPEEDADAELLEAYREMDEAGSSGDDEIEVDDYDMQVDVVNDTDDAIEDFDDDVGVVIERDHADPIGTNDPQAAEEEDVTADGQPSVSLPNTDGGGAGSEHGGDEGTLAGPSEVPPASATRDDDGMEGETGDQTLGSTSISAGASSVVMGGSMHLLDGDQETRQQVERNSQPAKEVSL